MDRIFDTLRGMILKELDEIASVGKLDENSLVCIYKMVDILKDIAEIEKESGYSQTSRIPMYPYDMNSYGNSYERRGGSNNYSYNSYNNGYSRDGDVMNKLSHMMDEASSEKEREIIRKVMDNMR